MQDRQSPQTIGKYQIVGTLGRGSMGVVYKGQDPSIGRFVAIKTLRKAFSGEFAASSTSLERFKLEARSAGNLRHPNIITVFDVNIEHDIPYMVMDYVAGESLDQVLLRTTVLDPAMVLSYLSEVASGLDYAHSMGVIHSDVKPSNIIVDSNQRVYILDFGIARLTESFAHGPKTEHEKQSTVMGTPGYMSPEQILNEKLDHRSDLFSLAVVAFECLTGQRPFPGATFSAIVTSILGGKPISLTSLRSELPLALEAEFERALARNRESRFNSGAEMVQAMCQALGLEGRVSMAGAIHNQRRRRLSTWNTLATDALRTSLGIRAQDALTSETDLPPAQPPALRSSIWDGYLKPVAGAAESPLAGQHESLRASSAAAAAASELESTWEKSRSVSGLSPVRIAVIMLGVVILILSGILFWVSMGGFSAPPAQPALSQDQTGTAGDLLAAPVQDESLAPPAVDPVPTGKSAEEMSDRELLGLVMSREVSEALVLAGIREARRRNLPGLIPAALIPLQNDSYVIRIEVIKVLAAIGDKRVVPNLLLRLDDYDPLVRGHAAKALGTLGSTAALGYLSARQLKEDDPNTRQAISTAIDKIRGFSAPVQ